MPVVCSVAAGSPESITHPTALGPSSASSATPRYGTRPGPGQHQGAQPSGSTRVREQRLGHHGGDPHHDGLLSRVLQPARYILVAGRMKV